MNFKQHEHEHVAQSWERMKLMLRNCPTHGLNLWMIIQKFYAGLNFVSRNLLDSTTGGTFMEITLGEATKFQDNIMKIIHNGIPKEHLLVRQLILLKKLVR